MPAITNFSDSDYNRLLAAGKNSTRRSVLALGRNESVSTIREDVVGWGDYTFQATAKPFYISSDNAADVGLVYVVELLDANYDRVITTGITNGLTGVQLIGPAGETNFIRGNTLFNVTPAETASLGNVYVGTTASPSAGIPTIANRVLQAYTSDQQSFQANYSVERNSTILLHSIIITTSRGASAGVEVDFKLETKTKGAGPFRVRAESQTRTDGNSGIIYTPPIPIDLTGQFREGMDLILTALAGAPATSVGGGFQIEIIPDA